MRRKNNYIMMKRATPKRVTLSDDRTFVTGNERVPRLRSLPNMKIRRRYRGAPERQRYGGIASIIKRLLTFWEKAAKKSSPAASQKI